MKFVVFGPERRTGVLREQNVVDVSLAFAKYLAERENEPDPLALAAALAPPDLARLIAGGNRALDNVEKALDHLFQRAHDQRGPRGEDVIQPLADVQLHAPRPQGARIACAGGNFADHAAAMSEKMHGRPYEGDASAQIRKSGIWGFWKIGRETVGPDGELAYPRKASRLDYEGELAIVLGRRCLDDKAASVEGAVWGITLLGDWSIRSPREPQGFHNFAMGKNFDGSCSLGPCIAVRETLPFAVDVETLVNGECRQRFNTRDMVFSFGEYLEYLSRDLTLYPGDIISGGTAAGTAADSSPLLPDGTSAPERFLKAGDTVEIRSPSVGSLRTRIVARGNA
jgi:2-keto-4-pentenoate hydratase/2-oxohepta-3-ene-1,7-dioic acid hydratase in catechol pathway